MLKTLAMGVLLFIASYVYAMGNVPMEHAGGSQAGQSFKDFTLPTVSNESKSFSSVMKGKKSILLFWATWCPHCHEAIVRINDRFKEIQEAGVNVVLVDVGEDSESVSAYLNRLGVGLDSFIDTDNVTAEFFQLIGVPTLFFIDEQGIIRSSAHRFPDDYMSWFNPS